MGIKLVIADDAPFIREVVLNLVGRTDIECVGEATTGDEAVDIVLKKRPDVVLMDLVMPEKNGIDAAIEIKEQFPSVKIIACSTQTQKDLIIKALNSGFNDFIEKPFKGKDLISKIKSVVK